MSGSDTQRSSPPIVTSSHVTLAPAVTRGREKKEWILVKGGVIETVLVWSLGLWFSKPGDDPSLT